SSDACRMYFLSKPLNQDFIFNEPELLSMKNLMRSIEEFFYKSYGKTDTLKAQFEQFAQSMQGYLKEKDSSQYVETLIQFFKETLWNSTVTQHQGLILLKFLYPICPFLAEELYQIIFKGKYLISDDGWII
ncbi:MAG: hypothetical protein K2N65_02510, partial [Anaeroplasmataceae bacterium]|nr:hypothetical protein [Anaeroplasmataceae bacterium]